MAHSNSSFSLSSELIIQIYYRTPLPSDVFALAATCSRLRSLWSANVNPIYNEVAPRSTACQQHARRFLTEQEEPALDTPMAMGDVVRMARNADVVEKAVLQFEREIVCRVRTDTYSAQELEAYYGVGARGHLPTLSCTERRRFISSYYTLWSLLRLDTSEWASRLEHMTSKQLYYLHRTTNLTQSIRRKEVVPPPLFPDEPPDSVQSINSGRSEKRMSLGEKSLGAASRCLQAHLRSGCSTPGDLC